MSTPKAANSALRSSLGGLTGVTVAILTPTARGSRTGNRHTAMRYARFLRAAGANVRVMMQWDDRAYDLLIALHARRSHDELARFSNAHPAAGRIVVLTGTDLYRDLPKDPHARASLAMADRIIALQARAPSALPARYRTKVDVVFQSVATELVAAPVMRVFRIIVIGHLRDEKDPFRALQALRLIPDSRTSGSPLKSIELLHVGGALDPTMRSTAEHAMNDEPRYRWIDTRPHAATLRLLASSHLMVISSRMEGGANVICEAARIGVPILASRVAGNVGMLGDDYPGYFKLGDERMLAELMIKSQRDKNFMRSLRQAVRARRALFAPVTEASGVVAAAARALQAAESR